METVYGIHLGKVFPVSSLAEDMNFDAENGNPWDPSPENVIVVSYSSVRVSDRGLPIPMYYISYIPYE